MRKIVDESRKKVKGQKLSFDEFLNSELDGITNMYDMGKQFICEVLEGKISDVELWYKNTSHFPYTTSLIVGKLYAYYHAMLVNNDKVDKNADRDLQILSHLNNSDIVVSNDIKFLKSAFDEIWKPLGKKLHSTKEFVNYLRDFKYELCEDKNPSELLQFRVIPA